MDPTVECDEAGNRQLFFMMCHCGNDAAAQKALATIRKFDKVVGENVARKP